MTSSPLACTSSTEALTGQETTSQSRGLFARASPLQNLTCWFSELSQKERKLSRRSSKRASLAASDAPASTAPITDATQDTVLAATVPEETSGDVSPADAPAPEEAMEVLQEQGDATPQPLTPGKAPASPTRLDTLASKSYELLVAQKDKSKPAAAVTTVDGVSTVTLAALHNAISGATFADLELVVGAGDNNTLVHSAVLAQAAPDVLAEIRRAEVLVLDSMEYSANVAPPKSTNGSIKLPAAAARARSHSHAVFPSSDADAHSDPALTPARRFSKVVSAGVRRARTFSVSDPASRTVVPTPAPAPVPEPVAPVASDDGSGITKVAVKGLSAGSLRALVFYLYTSHLNLVPWSTSTPPIAEEANDSADAIELLGSEGFGNLGATPPPFDALAAYALGETLKIEHMATRALAFIIVNLQPNTALPLLLSPQAERFPQLRLSILEYVAETWDGVKAAPGTQVVLKKLARGEYPYCGTALLSLLLDLDSHGHHKAETK